MSKLIDFAEAEGTTTEDMDHALERYGLTLREVTDFAADAAKLEAQYFTPTDVQIAAGVLCALEWADQQDSNRKVPMGKPDPRNHATVLLTCPSTGVRSYIVDVDASGRVETRLKPEVAGASIGAVDNGHEDEFLESLPEHEVSADEEAADKRYGS